MSYKVFHFNFGTEGNKGDAAVIFAIKELLNSQIEISTYTEEKIQKLSFQPYPEKIFRAYRKLQKLPFLSKLFFGWSVTSWILPSLLKPFEMYKSRQDQTLADFINSHDLVIIGGGGVYSSKWLLPMNNTLIKAITKPMVIFGAGFNRSLGDREFNDQDKESIRVLNSQAKLCSVRDENTAQLLKSLNLPSILTGDPAIYLKPESVTAYSFPQKKLKLGINIAYQNWGSLQEKYIGTILESYVQSIKALQKNQKVELYYLVHSPAKYVLNGEVKSEYQVVEKLKEHFPNLIVMDNSASELRWIYEKLDFVICMMLHSSILSFSAATPFINIAYDEKNHGFMRLIEQEDWIIPVQEVSPSLLSQKLFSGLEQKNLIQQAYRLKKLELETKTNQFVSEIKQLLN